jgi:hypothetical protein
MIISVDLPEGIAYLHVCFVVISPMLFAAVDWYSAVGALKVDMGGRCSTSARLPRFWIIWIVSDAGLSMRGMWAVSVLLYIGSSSTDLWDW